MKIFFLFLLALAVLANLMGAVAHAALTVSPNLPVIFDRIAGVWQ